MAMSFVTIKRAASNRATQLCHPLNLRYTALPHLAQTFRIQCDLLEFVLQISSPKLRLLSELENLTISLKSCDTIKLPALNIARNSRVAVPMWRTATRTGKHYNMYFGHLFYKKNLTSHRNWLNPYLYKFLSKRLTSGHLAGTWRALSGHSAPAHRPLSIVTCHR